MRYLAIIVTLVAVNATGGPRTLKQRLTAIEDKQEIIIKLLKDQDSKKAQDYHKIEMYESCHETCNNKYKPTWERNDHSDTEVELREAHSNCHDDCNETNKKPVWYVGEC